MENYGKSPSDLKIFLSSLLGYKELEVYPPSILEFPPQDGWINLI